MNFNSKALSKCSSESRSASCLVQVGADFFTAFLFSYMTLCNISIFSLGSSLSISCFSPPTLTLVLLLVYEVLGWVKQLY